jgi:hypothetical protein
MSLGLIVLCCMGAIDTVAAEDMSTTDAVGLGERIYRQGIGVDGKPVTAVVVGDISVDGRMFSCVNCHQHSGIGTVEGSVITWPINGKELFVPRRRTGAWNPAAEGRGPGAPERWSLPPQYQVPDARPAYTEQSLAHVLRSGEDPTGRQLNPVMPRYRLSEADMHALIAYLKQLSDAYDPGVDETSLHFATVVTEGVDPQAREAMLAVLKAHVDARNTQTRPHLRRATQGPFYKTEKFGAYRKLTLDVWELKRPAETWGEQLEAYYNGHPVFALLGGIGTGSWEPVHRFCEHHQLPNILPITDQPVVSDSNWYTLYFSKGLYQEGEAAARFLRSRLEIKERPRILQLYRTGQPGEAAARGFSENWQPAASPDEVVSVKLEGDDPAEVIASHADADVLILWLEGDDLDAALSALKAEKDAKPSAFVSSTLLGKDTGRLPESLRPQIYLTYPYSLPNDNPRRRHIVERWLKGRGIPVTNPEIQSKMYFLGWMLPGALSYMRSEFYRDYFLEGFDMMTDQDYAIPIYPRLTFGPGQRYASKGCYIVQVEPGETPQLVSRSQWVIH